MATVGEARRALVERLARAGVATPAVDADLLVAAALGVGRGQLRARHAEPVDVAQAEVLDRLASRRAAREPLQLLLGTVGFRHLDLEVHAGVFIPRPETEVLAGLAIERTPAGGVVIEPCTGTGAVACAVASEAAPERTVATDASPGAVALARANAARLGLAVDVRLGDLLEPVAELRGAVDVLVANPPYVAEDELAGLEPEVAQHDPRIALVAGPTGHEVSDRLITAAPEWLRRGGWLLLEVDHRRAAETARRCTAAGLRDAATVADLAGRQRFVVARL